MSNYISFDSIFNVHLHTFDINYVALAFLISMIKGKLFMSDRAEIECNNNNK